MGKAGRKQYELWTAVYLNNENINIEKASNIYYW